MTSVTPTSQNRATFKNLLRENKDLFSSPLLHSRFGEISSMLDIDKRAKKMLFKSQSEKDRLIILKRILKKAIVKIDYEDPMQSGYHNYSQFEA